MRNNHPDNYKYKIGNPVKSSDILELKVGFKQHSDDTCNDNKEDIKENEKGP